MGASKRASTGFGANTPLPAPVPQLEVPTIPAPGQRGPRGLVGRQTYSRVNTGAPQAADAGAQAQKSIPPAGTKKTSEVNMTIAARPTIQDMLKMAMAGTSSAAGSAVSRIKVAEEAKRQLENLDEEGPPESKKDKDDEEELKEKVSSEYAIKLASAVEYCADILEKEGADLAGPYTLTETPMAPGTGPNALEISGSPMPAPVNLKHTGQAINANQPPITPPTQKAMPQERGENQLQNDIDDAPADGEPPMSGDTTNYAKIARVVKIAGGDKKKKKRGEKDISPLNATVLGTLLGGPGGGLGAYYGGGKAVRAGAPASEGALRGGFGAAGGAALGGTVGGLGGAALGGGLGALGGSARLGANIGGNLGTIGGGIYGGRKGYQYMTEKYASLAACIRTIKKMAEDAGSPSSISAGPVQQDDQGPPGVLNSSETGPPAQDKGKVPVGHDETRAFTRADAKATPKQEMQDVLKEPMMSSKTDKVLDINLSHDGDSKISSARDVTKVAAARALLSKLHREARN